MRIEGVVLVNFRGIKSIDIEFPTRTTVIVGVNGVGKSAVLDAIAILMSQLIWRIQGQHNKARHISQYDVRVGEIGAAVRVDVQFNGESTNWKLFRLSGDRDKDRTSDDQRSELGPLNEAVGRYKAELEALSDPLQACYPLAVYYDVHRAVLQVPLRVREKLPDSPMAAYRESLEHGGVDFKRFFIWVRNQELLERRSREGNKSYRDPRLQAVRQAIEAFTGFKNLSIKDSPLRMTLNKDGTELTINQLSDGEKCLLALVGDIARRLATLNPGLENKLAGHGVVLIDEIDLHLHPRWQREVISKLEATFENCQFILTSHSPLILGHIKPENIWLLKTEDGVIRHFRPRASYGLDINTVLDELMGVVPRETSVEESLHLIFRLLESNDLTAAGELLEEMTSQLGDVPELLRARALLRRKELLGR